MSVKMLPVAVLVAAVTGLVVSVGWAVARSGDSGWMMSRYGSGMMGLSSPGRGQPVRDITAARHQAQRFADRLGLKTGEVMRFTNNYYAELIQKNGRRATEVLIDPTRGSVWFEYGPAMMWNTRFGMMSDFRAAGRSGMMGGSGMMAGSAMMGSSGMTGGMMGGTVDRSTKVGSRTLDVSAREARAIAQRWLRRNGSGLTAGDADAFPGYYTLHTLRNGEITGMMSVNARSGAVWFHWWHGRFISMSA